MSSGILQNTTNLASTKRQRTADDDISSVPKQSTTTTTSATKKPQQEVPPRMTHVYVVYRCQVPLQNRKWGEHSGHETEDAEVLGTFASLEDANQEAKCAQSEFECEDDEESEDDEDEGGDDLFYWEDEEPCEWTSSHIWVEKHSIQY